ncbi:glycerophosphodiester phosphodiesterase family protein [Streptomyces sp. GC420]|uniref:glycerophosphodiester phosphodiesterase family protein n=1 Tax=Streptomyces sp. GC420 TaxID=2697568 RepID=UPI001DAA5512|nr:glycerophosphodiester phosphodiesterase family protein [Streptomyces sp. GC420]NBM19521.1 DUF2029 domain-containing protein [Streptomyces sp. GC420]
MHLILAASGGPLAVLALWHIRQPGRATSFGQVELLPLTPVLADARPPTARWSRWAGAGIGPAAAVEPTPAPFIGLLLLTGRRRAPPRPCRWRRWPPCRRPVWPRTPPRQGVVGRSAEPAKPGDAACPVTRVHHLVWLIPAFVVLARTAPRSRARGPLALTAAAVYAQQRPARLWRFDEDGVDAFVGGNLCVCSPSVRPSVRPCLSPCRGRPGTVPGERPNRPAPPGETANPEDSQKGTPMTSRTRMPRRIARLLAPLTALCCATALLAAEPAAARPLPQVHRPAGPRGFDLQAHRGGLGLVVESTLDAFSSGLAVGVSTLELDVQITEDHRAVVTHDRKVSGAKCQDTGPVVPGDPEFPYVGKYVTHLTLAQVRTLDCGSRTLPQFPAQRPSPGARMPLLTEVFDLVKRRGAHGVWLNIETKVEAGAPHETASREEFVRIVARQVRASGLARRVSVQSFDWGALMRMRQVAPELPIVALTNGAQFLQPGLPGASPWLGGIDIDDFDGDVVAAVDSFGADVLSPVHGDPQGGSVTDPGYVPYTTKSLVRSAHRAGIRVVPWTVDDRATMNKLIDDGVDGLITDYPDRLREVMAERGLKLPKRYPARG